MTLLTSESAMRQAVVEVARGELGKHHGVSAPTPYGRWYGAAWERAYFCAAGWSWSWYQALGEELARRVIGFQAHGGTAPKRRGFVWTVAIMQQHRPHRVPLKELRPGDALMFRYNSGDDRQGNEVNHVDLVEVNHPGQGCVDVIGFNVPKPGAPAGSDPGRGGGVWRRRIHYNNRWVVAGLQMPVASVVPKTRGTWSTIQKHLTTLGLAELKGTGEVGPATRAGVLDYARTYRYTGRHDDPAALLTHLESTMSNIHEELSALRGEVRALQAKVDGQGGLLTTIGDAVREPSIAKAVWQYSFAGHAPFNAWWFLRRGAVLNPEHKQFPADPGSPADFERLAAQQVLGCEIEPCVAAVPRERPQDATGQPLEVVEGSGD